VPRRMSQGRGLSSVSPETATTPNNSINHARAGSNLLGLDLPSQSLYIRQMVEYFLDGGTPRQHVYDER
jgi:hypothetical protein